MVNPTTVSVYCPDGLSRPHTDQGHAASMKPRRLPVHRRWSWASEASKAGRLLRKEERFLVPFLPAQGNDSRALQKAPSNIRLSNDQHMSIRKWPQRVRNNCGKPHARPRVLLLPSRQTEIPQKSQRTGQSAQKSQGSVWGIVRPRLSTARSHPTNISCCLQETYLTFSSFIEK